MAHGSISRRKNREQRKLERASRKRAMQEQYKAWAYAGITKKSRRATMRVRAAAKLAKDNKQVNVVAVLNRPQLGKPAGWVNRKAALLNLDLLPSGIKLQRAAKLLGLVKVA
jgi:hypothetical protein